MIRKIGFARIHVFPYSPRPGTPAAGMPGQLTSAEKEKRARDLIGLGRQVAREYLLTWIGLETDFLPEEEIDGSWEGYTPEYIRVRLEQAASCHSGKPVRVRLLGIIPGGMPSSKNSLRSSFMTIRFCFGTPIKWSHAFCGNGFRFLRTPSCISMPVTSWCMRSVMKVSRCFS